MKPPRSIGLCLFAALSACNGPETAEPRKLAPIVEDEPALDWGMAFDETAERQVEELRLAVEENPQDAESHRRLGLALRQARRPHEALASFATAVELQPEHERYRLDLALAYTAVARLPEAQAIYRGLLESTELRPVVLHNLGNIALRLEKLDEAIEEYREALELRPDYVLARYHLGMALQEIGRPEEAYAAFDQVLRSGPYESDTDEAARFDALHRMGSLDLARGDAEQALGMLAKLLEHFPEHPNANYTHGRALMELGRVDEAQQAFERHLRVPVRTEGRMGFIGAPGSDRPSPDAGRLRFQDATEAAGIRYLNVCGAASAAEKGWATEALGAGAAWLDYDGDGALDLYLVNGSAHDRGPLEGEPNQLYRGDGRGHFVEVTERAGVGHRGWGYGVAVGDVDNDHDPDIYVTNYGPNVLYRNDGDGTFTDVTEEAGVADPHWGVSAAFFDMENDGDLDLYVGNYLVCGPGKVPRRGETPFCAWKGIDVSCGPKGLIPMQDVLYRNNGNGTFTDWTRESGTWLDEPRYTLGVVTADYDNDGDQDIYVANDSVRNSLWKNNGDGTFTDVGVTTMSAFNADGHSQSGMGTDFGDYNGDGWLDIVATNFSHDLNSLYRNVEGRYFVDESSTSGLAVTTMMLSWGTGFFDFDLDGDLDLFIANGHIFPEVDDYDLGTDYRQPNHLFLNRGAGRLVESSAVAGPGFAIRRSFRGAAFGDPDGDGDVDVLLTALGEAPLLLRNDSDTGNHHLTLVLAGTRSNRDGVGARVVLTTDLGRVIRERQGGGSYLSANGPWLHFGLGRSERAEKIEVHWPSGVRDVLYDVAGDRRITITEGAHPVRSP